VTALFLHILGIGRNPFGEARITQIPVCGGL
jgi:hypothetical protein